MSEKPGYPLEETARDAVHTKSGRLLSEITLEAVRSGAVGQKDLSIHPDTLRRQAELAEDAGYPQLAANLRRAAEMALIPDDRVLAIYEALRPYRVPYARLVALADELEEEYAAVETARLVREAADAYRRRGLI